MLVAHENVVDYATKPLEGDVLRSLLARWVPRP